MGFPAHTNCMTTIAVAVKDGIAAIGADTMTKYGFAKERAEYVVNHDKIFRVGESYLALAGPAVGKLALEHYFTEALGRVPTLESAQAIFATWLKVHHALRETYFLRVGGRQGRRFRIHAHGSGDRQRARDFRGLGAPGGAAVYAVFRRRQRA